MARDCSFIFVGERRSQLARRMGVRWEDGRLAAKQLFDALRACDVDPTACLFLNLFHESRGVVRQGVVRRLRSATSPVVALGLRVAAELSRHGVPHVRMTHPAARGVIRRKAHYAAHVRAVLLGQAGPQAVPGGTGGTFDRADGDA